MTGAAAFEDHLQEATPPRSRMAIAVLAMIGLFVSGYLALFSFGFLGALQCGIGGCMVVQTSAYAWFPPRTVSNFGIPVPLMGIVAYTILLVLAIVGLQPGYVRSRAVAVGLLAMAGIGVLFSAWLTYLEAAVIRAWCQWCVVSAILVTIIFLFSVAGLREARR